MKHISKIILFSTLLLVMIFSGRCRSNEKMLSKITFEGYVYDSLGGNPTNGVWVSLKACDEGDSHNECGSFVVGQAQTDISGHFYIHDNAARSNRYDVFVNNRYVGSGPGFFNNNSDDLKKYFSKIYFNKLF